MPAEDDAAEETQEEVVNPLAEYLKDQLAKPPSRLGRRESVSRLFDKSETFADFRKGKDPRPEDEAGVGEEERASPASIKEDPKRSDSARQWDADSGMRAEAELNAFLREQGGPSLEQSVSSIHDGGKPQEDDSFDGEQLENGQSMQEGSAGDIAAEGDYYDDGAVYDSLAMVQEERSGSHDASYSLALDRDTVIHKHVLGGTVSTYKHKGELRSQLERRAGLKFIRERREQVQARHAVAKEAEEKVAVAQGHVDECQSKIAKLRDEAAKLLADDQFGNREKVITLQGRIAVLGGKLQESQAELGREAEIEYVARREFNNAEIELRKVEELESDLQMEEEYANAEQRLLAHVRAEKERDAAVRFEVQRQKREAAEAEQRRRDSERTSEAASIAKAGRVAAIKRVKEARRAQDTALQSFEEARVGERERRAQALLELKANMEAAADQIRGGNARKYKKIKAVQASRTAEKAEIMAAGGNPYAVWRQQEAARVAERKKQEREMKMKDMENRLLVQLAEEEARRKEKEAHDARHKHLEKEFQAQMGGAAKQKHTVEYMRERTVGGKEVLDPTGREPRIYPSKATVLMDWKFGLGRKPYPPGATPGEELPPGHPEGYVEESAEGVDGEGWRRTQKNRLIDKMHRKFPGEDWNQTLVGSRYLDDTMRRTRKGDKTREQMEEEAALVAMLDAHEAQRQQAAAADGNGAEEGEADREGEEGGEQEQLPEATIPRKQEVFAVPEFHGIWGADAAAEVGEERKMKGTLSKLEQEYLRAAMERKKAGYGWIEKQVVWGREFKGTAFVASEKGKDVAAIEFVDFVPGHVYKRKVTLTNASYSFNTFKLLELPDAVKDFFTISYAHPGALSPGMTCDLHIKFEPKLNEDIIECIPLLCQTGPQDIPLRCLTKKVTVSTPTPEVELNVIMGESVTRDILLVNKGCLDCPFTIHQLRHAPRQDFIAEDLAAAARSRDYLPTAECEPTLAYAVEGVAKGYSTTKVSVTFTPTEPAAKEIPLHLEFKKAMSEPQSEDIFVMLRPTAFEVPIYVQEPLMDVRCCCYGVTYAQTLVVRNRGKIALKTMPQVPPQMRGFVSFTPDMAYVQARGHDGEDGLFAFRIRFEPQPKLLEKCAEFVQTGPTGKPDTIAVPVRVAVPDQVLPVYFTLRAQLTTADLELSARELDFGECAISDAVMLRETVTNCSELPCRIGFLKLPRGVSVKPALGLCSLLPNESRTLEITFEPYTDSDFHFPITLTSSHNRHVKIPCKASGVRAPLVLSCSTFALKPCAPSDRVTESFFASNQGTVPRTLEVMVPKNSGLKISPVVATIEPGASLRFNLDFCPVAVPPVDLGQPSVADLGATQPKGDGEESEEGGGEAAEEAAVAAAAAEEEEEELEDEVDEDGNVVLDDEGNPIKKKKEPPVDPLALTPEEAELRAALLVEETESCEEGEAWSQHSTWQFPILVKDASVMYVQVKTSTVQPLIVAQLHGKKLASEVGKDGVEKLGVIDFGKLPVGQERVLDVKLSNVCELQSLARDTDVHPLALDPLGPFSILKYPSTLQSGQSQTISLSFQPKREAAFRERLVLRSGKNAVRCVMVGYGVSPVFETQGLTDSSDLNGDGRIDIGDVLKNSNVELPFKLTNNSPFEVAYCVELANKGEVNMSGLNPFDCVPTEASVAAGESKDLVLSLSADTCSLAFEANLRIVVPNQREKMDWRVKGRCWPQAMFAFDASLDALCAPPDVNRFKDQMEEASDSIALEKTFAQAKAQRREADEHELVIGNCGASGSGDFSFDNAADAAALGFVVEPSSGKVDPGGKVPVKISYSPPAGGPLSLWNEIVLQATLRGGTPVAASGAVNVALRLRGFVPAQL